MALLEDNGMRTSKQRLEVEKVSDSSIKCINNDSFYIQKEMVK